MERYKNSSGHSGIHSFELRPEAIAVKFSGTECVYVYSYRSAGNTFVEKMKLLARSGRGLNSFIQTNARRLYER